MLLEYDPDADAIYISLAREEVPVAKTVELDDERNVGYAADGTPIGVELLNVSHGVRLADIPHASEISELRSVGRLAVAS